MTRGSLLHFGDARDRQPTMVGRAAELATAMAVFRTAQVERFRLLLLSGEAGIGKTRLAEEIVNAAAADGAQAFWGRGWSGDGMPALWPWLQVVRGLAATLDDDRLRATMGAERHAIAAAAPEIAARLGLSEAPVDLHAPDLQFLFFDGVAGLLAAFGRHQPLVVVLDDLHWSDLATLRLLRFLARDPRPTPALVIGTYRDQALSESTPVAAALNQVTSESCATVIHLAGLGPSLVAEQMALVCEAPMPEDVVAVIHEATGGNPLLVAEAARRLRATDGSGPVATERFLTRVEDLFATRLHDLSPVARAAVEAGAVAARYFRIGVLRRVLAGLDADSPPGDETLLAALYEAVRARLIVPVADQVGEFTFVHDLVRTAVYRQLAPTRRVVLHRRIADALAALFGANVEAHVSTLAYHASEGLAAGGEPETAVEWAVRAGRQALAVADVRRAVDHFERGLRALEFVGSIDDRVTLRRADLFLDLAEARRQGNHPEARDAVRSAVDLARPLLAGAVAAGASAVLVRAALAGRTDDAAIGSVTNERIALCDEALHAIGPADEPRRAELLARQATLLYESGACEAAFARVREAVAMASRLRDPTALRAALDAHHTTLWIEPDVEARLAVSGAVVALAQGADAQAAEQRAHTWHAIDLLDLGRVVEADREIAAAVRLAHALREPRYAYMPACLQAARAYMRGHLDEATRLTERALEIGERAQVPHAPIHYLLTLFTISHERNQLDVLDKVMQRATRLFDEIPGLAGLATLSAIRFGQRDEARAALAALVRDRIEVHPRPFNWLSMLHAAAVAACDLQAVEIAGRLYDVLRAHAHRNLLVHFGVVITGSMWRASGMLAAVLGRSDDALDHFARALAFDEGMAAPPFILDTRFRLGEALLVRPTRAERQRGRAMLDDVVRGADALGMAQLAASARAVIDGNRVTVAMPPEPNRCERIGNGWVLTFEGRTVHLRDAKGLRYLSLLLARPDESVHCTELVTLVSPVDLGGGPPPEGSSIRRDLGSAGPTLDAAARRQYQRRLADLRAELDDAEAHHDLGRAATTRSAIEWLVRELGAAAGIGGRSRSAGSHVERARLAVRQRLKATLTQIHETHPPLAAHLQSTLRTGVFCRYAPGMNIRWDVRPGEG